MIKIITDIDGTVCRVVMGGQYSIYCTNISYDLYISHSIDEIKMLQTECKVQDLKKVIKEKISALRRLKSERDALRKDQLVKDPFGISKYG